ncbi:PIN domain-containing protein [Arthrobacter sp. YAF34]|uniref:PIN domain-containing protein n=1 Tax=Arthrobacter sp. YAF34 TaxID=3233083 RepID=UPI003F917B8F
MISLLSGASPAHALTLLEGAESELRNAHGRAPDAIALFNEYYRWAGEQMRLLVTLVPTSELDRLVTTPWHWALSGMDLSQPGQAIRSSMEAQITETLRRLDGEARELRGELARWDSGRAVAAVLDTNVLADHLQRLATMDWHTLLGVRPPTPVVLAVPLAVIDELDKHKQSNQREPKSSNRPDLRDRARHALKWIESNLDDPDRVTALGAVKGDGPPHSPLRLALIRQGVRHVPLSDTDSEIIDRALSLEGFASRVHLVTSDTGMIFRARGAGLAASRPEPEQSDQTN